MKKAFWLVLIAVSIQLSSMACAARAEVIDKIAVIVNDEAITDGEIDRIVSVAYEKMRAAYRGAALMKKLEETRQQVIEQLVNDKLMLSAARKEWMASLPES